MDKTYVTTTDLELSLRRFEERLLSKLDGMVGETVGNVVGEIVGDAMQLIEERFNKQDIELMALRATTDRVENKLDATINRVDNHEGRLNKLEQPASQRSK